MSAGVPVKSRGGVMVKSAGGGLQDNTWKGAYGYNVIGTGVPESMACQSNGKIIVLGGYSQHTKKRGNKVYSVNGISRLRSDGVLDSTFNRDSSVTFDSIDVSASVVILDSNKIVCGGNFTDACGQPVNNIVRLDEDGFFESSYGTGFNGRVRKILKQEDGKIICVGDFTEYNGVVCNYIVRINTNESIDAGFNASGIRSLSAYLFDNGNIMCLLKFPYGMTLLDSSGNIISSFAYTPEQKNNWVHPAEATAFLKHSNGMYFVAERFHEDISININTEARICRLSSTGSYLGISPTFVSVSPPQVSPLAAIYDIYQTDENDLLCVGDFTLCGATPVTGITTLNTSLSVEGIGHKALYVDDDDHIVNIQGVTDQYIPAINKSGIIVYGRYLGFTTTATFSPYTDYVERWGVARLNTDLTIDKYPGEVLE